MNKDELKKKIMEVLNKNFTEEVECTPVYTTDDGKEIELPEELCEMFNDIVTQAVIPYFADALIAAGYGDVKDLQAQVDVLEITNIALQAGYDDAEKDRLYWVDKYKEAEHRADVAERALRNAAPRLNCRGGLGKGFCKVDKCDYYHCNNDDGCVKAHLDQAEKELAEEGER